MRVRLTDDTPAVTLSVAELSLFTFFVLIVIDIVVCPAPIVQAAGTSTSELLDVMVTGSPESGAGPLSFKTATMLPPPRGAISGMVKLRMVGAIIVRDAVLEYSPAETSTVATLFATTGFV